MGLNGRPRPDADCRYSYLPADDALEGGGLPALGEAGDVGDVGVRAEGVLRLFLGERGLRAAYLGQQDSAAVLEAAHPAAPHELRDLGWKRPLKGSHMFRLGFFFRRLDFRLIAE